MNLETPRGPVILCTNAQLLFVIATDGRGSGIGAICLRVTSLSQVSFGNLMWNRQFRCSLRDWDRSMALSFLVKTRRIYAVPILWRFLLLLPSTQNL